MPRPADVEPAIRRGLAFLDKTQETDGSFVSWSSRRPEPFRRIRTWRTVFVPALMLGALGPVANPEAFRIREGLAGFLYGQKDDNWSFNYWAKDAPEYKTQAYPNDLDDTFCALAGLYMHDPALVDEAALARAIKLLLATETEVGGPYRTWLVSSDSAPIWLDVDAAVNSNVAWFLSSVSDVLPKLERLMDGAIASDTYSSPYYPSEHTLVYFFARSYDGPFKKQLLRKARRLGRSAGNDLERALILSARLRLGETQDLSAAARALAAGQGREGAWPAAAFYEDPVKDDKRYYNGGPALTTAFALEALTLYARAGQAPQASRTAKDSDTRDSILESARTRNRGLNSDIRIPLADSLRKLADGDNGDEIMLLPHRFNDSLLRPLPDTAAQMLDDLGLANLYGWLAYTIYDDFLDETGNPRLLPVANMAMRRSLDIFSEASPDQGLPRLARAIFDIMDGANAWEQTRCRAAVSGGRIKIERLPDYGDLSKLAERSLGHTLPPLAVLLGGGMERDSEPFDHVRMALKHYLIVRQLNDDVHDWPEDLQNGHLSYVVTRLLADMGVTRGEHDTAVLSQTARRQFWHATLPDLCREMRLHVKTSRSELRRSGLFKPGDIISLLIGRLDDSISDTLKKQRGARKFLRQYQSR